MFPLFDDIRPLLARGDRILVKFFVPRSCRSASMAHVLFNGVRFDLPAATPGILSEHERAGRIFFVNNFHVLAGQLNANPHAPCALGGATQQSLANRMRVLVRPPSRHPELAPHGPQDLEIYCGHLWHQADGTKRAVPFGQRHGNGAVAAVVEDLISAFMFLYFPDKTKLMNKSAVFLQTGVQNYIITSLDVTRARFVRDQALRGPRWMIDPAGRACRHRRVRGASGRFASRPAVRVPSSLSSQSKPNDHAMRMLPFFSKYFYLPQRKYVPRCGVRRQPKDSDGGRRTNQAEGNSKTVLRQ